MRPGEVHEVRIPQTRKGPQRLFGTASGYFDNADAVVAALKPITGADAVGVYITMNPVKPALLARACNQLGDKVKATTSDDDILCRRHLLVDLDPVRDPADVSAADEEVALAILRRDAIRQYLTEEHGWPDPIVSSETGNGGALLYDIDLPNDAAATDLVQRVLAALDALFSDASVKVDVVNYNAARIIKVVGSIAAKGEHFVGHAPLPDRPWRLATATYPDESRVVSAEQLAALAAEGPAPEAPRGRRQQGQQGQQNHQAGPVGQRTWTVDELLAANGLDARPRSWRGGTKYLLSRCLTSSDHTDGAALLEMPSGALVYRCHHDRCAGKDWSYLRKHNIIRLPNPSGSNGDARPSDRNLGGKSHTPAGPGAGTHAQEEEQAEPRAGQADGDTQEGASPEAGGDRDRHGESQASKIVKLAQTWDLFHTPDGDAYATFPGDAGVQQTWPLGSRMTRGRLKQLYYTRHGGVPGAQAVHDALGVLEGRALFTGAERSVFLRLAEDEGVIYLDLCDSLWRVVAISAQGWRVLPGSEAPVRFRRTKGMLPLPEPQRGGSIATLRTYLNVPKNDEQTWRMIVAWLVAALRPRGPYPILVCVGEHGAAKSSMQRLLRALVDPHRVPLRRPPRDDRDQAIANNNNWAPVFENVSYVPDWLSDALCALATGAGYATRKLYEDDEEALFEAQRPVMMNGIELMLTRGDALDRALIVHQPAVTDDERRLERELWPAFERDRPAIVGALLDAVATALRHEPSVKLKRLPRMADFAHWVTAAEPGLGWAEGSFMEMYDQTRADVHGVALEASLIAAPLFTVMKTTGTWEGTARDLLEKLNGMVTEDERKKKEWPKQANTLSGQLSRIAPHLRALGLSMTTSREGKARRKVIHLRLEQCGTASSASSASSAADDNQPHLGMDERLLADDRIPLADDLEPLADDLEPLADDGAGVADDADDHVQHSSQRTDFADSRDDHTTACPACRGTEIYPLMGMAFCKACWPDPKAAAEHVRQKRAQWR
jgi:hypothetical protein